ncbi:MAG TPA: SRPBCC family protein [Actinomycetota bacterium]|nr:SRPBCC family protein [Actinomycetota bacterium]
MIAIEESIVIDLPRRRVFALAARPENMPLWNSAVLKSEFHGALREGARVVQCIHLLGHRFETAFRVTCYEPPRRVTYTSTHGPMDIRGTMEFLPLQGRTLVRWTVAGSGRAFFRVGEGVLVRVGRHEMHSCLENLKRFVEQTKAGRGKTKAPAGVPHRLRRRPPATPPAGRPGRGRSLAASR